MFKNFDRLMLCATNSVCLTFVTVLVGKIDYALIFLLIGMITDFITGMLCGFYNKNLSSNTAIKGLMKKLFILVYVMLAHHLDVLLNTQYIRTAVCYLYATGEVLSIIENGSTLGLPVPDPIKKALEILNGGDEDEK